MGGLGQVRSLMRLGIRTTSARGGGCGSNDITEGMGGITRGWGWSGAGGARLGVPGGSLSRSCSQGAPTRQARYASGAPGRSLSRSCSREAPTRQARYASGAPDGSLSRSCSPGAPTRQARYANGVPGEPAEIVFAGNTNSTGAGDDIPLGAPRGSLSRSRSPGTPTRQGHPGVARRARACRDRVRREHQLDRTGPGVTR
jgi:hypothetical protein